MHRNKTTAKIAFARLDDQQLSTKNGMNGPKAYVGHSKLTGDGNACRICP